jgi:transposase
MLYLGIDLHRKQLTVSVRNEKGDVILRRQVSTRWDKVREFLKWVQAEALREGGFVAVVETCGFEGWLIGLLKEYGCRDVVLIQPEKRSKKKTDRRDAHAMSELLWVNRQRLLAGQKVQGVRRVRLASVEEQEDRRITAARQRAGRQRTRTINQIKYILRRHNLEWECPTKTFETKKVRKWLREIALSAVERLEMNHLLAQWDLWDQQIEELEKVIAERFQQNPTAQILSTAPGVSAYSGLALAARIGPIENFPRPRSLANYWGLTPGCRNSGEATDRLGSITKQGSPMARFILGQLVIHALRKDAWMRAWYGRIKRRRGSKIARVAVMRRLATIFWHMVKHQEPYVAGGPPRLRYQRTKVVQGAA